MSSPEPTSSRIDVLLAEDDALVARDLEETLVDLGYDVVGVASSGAEAMELARERRPDLALMDIRMPGEMSGIDAALAIDDELDTPVVYLTAFADRDTLRRVARSDPYGYVVKPFESRELEASIELALQRKRRERAREEREQWFEQIIQRVRDVVLVLDESGTVEYVSPAVEDVLGLSPEHEVGRDVLDLVHEDDREHVRACLRRALDDPGASMEVEARFGTSGDGWRLLHVIGAAYETTGSRPSLRVVVNARDVTERREEQRRLEASEERYRILFEEGIAGAFQADMDGELIDVNRSLAEILGSGGREELVGRTIEGLFHSQDWESVRNSLEEEGAAVNREVRAVRREDETSYLLLSCGVGRVPGRQEPVIIGTVVDITERKRLESRLEWMAYHDPLTGLVNRRSLVEQASRYVALAERRGSPLAVAYLDLSGFKSVNDEFGHEAGDTVLAEVARRLESEARESDIVARVGGDEFVVLMPEVDSPEAAAGAAHRFSEALRAPVELDGERVSVRGDFGVAAFPEDASSFDELLEAADAAMYGLKKAGEGDVALYGRGSRREPESKRVLSRALKSGEFFVEYQPIVRADDDAVVGAEAFARWSRSPDRTATASEFLPEIERSGMSIRFDRHMLDLVRRDVSSADLPETLQWISVNVTPASLAEEEIVDRLIALADELDERGLRVVVEVSDYPHGNGTRAVEQELARLREENVMVALDNFGSGSSPLEMLSSLSAELVKVNPEGMAAARQPTDRDEAVSGLVRLVHALGARVVIEGLQEPEHRDRARREGADFLQGWATGRPGSITSLARSVGEPR